ncbi:TPA: EpsG family protein [Providencia alcalifaciens]
MFYYFPVLILSILSILSIFDKNKITYWLSIFTFVLLSIFLSIRVNVGFDWSSYLDIFNNRADYEILDPGYILINSLFDNYNTLVFVITICISLSLLLTYTRYSFNISHSLLLLLLTNIWFYNWLYYRQSLAIFILLIPFILNSKRNIVYLISCCIASLFHSATLLIIPFFLFKDIFLSNKKIYIICLSTVLITYFSNYVKELVLYINTLINFGFNYYLSEGNTFGETKSTLGLTKIWILVVYIYCVFIDKNKGSNFIRNLALYFIVFQLLSIPVDILNRVSMFFSAFYPLYISNTLHRNLKQKNLFIMSLVISSIFFVFYLNYIAVSKIGEYQF